ncbi:BHLH domain-containing protein [Mycena venus]|uniref:BHLH domain-containing protein n=1 Tax=Mycena venus TaxID=2733690 RepID=A0A8H6Y881_9AGAR|nr:BHLH domain-containing protein [Mycena venus]
MASGAPNHDSALSSAPATAMDLSGIDITQLQANGLQAAPGVDAAQLMNILKFLPNLTKQLADNPLKEDAAQALSNLSQFGQGGTGPGGFRVSDPGPSSHPHGPPPLAVPQNDMLGMPPVPENGGNGDHDDGEYVDRPTETPARKGPGGGGRGRGRGGAQLGSDEWARQRKDNHKEVERRRRGNINDGINELGRIVPNGAGTENAAKAAILSRAVQYIHHLKENEARNIEKWTLEKLLMDQAMGDLQVQLDEIRRMWEEERMLRQRAEQELEVARAEKRALNPDGDVEGGEAKKQRTE